MDYRYVVKELILMRKLVVNTKATSLINRLCFAPTNRSPPIHPRLVRITTGLAGRILSPDTTDGRSHRPFPKRLRFERFHGTQCTLITKRRVTGLEAVCMASHPTTHSRRAKGWVLVLAESLAIEGAGITCCFWPLDLFVPRWWYQSFAPSFYLVSRPTERLAWARPKSMLKQKPH
jgi:hypothetical protein